MRILHVIDSLVPGGAERSLAGVASHMARLGVELHVVPLTHRPGVQAELVAGGAIVHPAAGALRQRAIPRLKRLIHEVGPDLVHTTLFEADIAGRIAARAAHRPPVTSLVSTSYLPPPHSSTAARVRLGAALAADVVTARLAVRFHAVSHTVAATMSRRLYISRDKIEVIHRGRDLQVLGSRTPERRARVRGTLRIEGSSPVVLSVARHDPRKGLDVLVAAWPAVAAAVPAALLLIAGGDGPATPSLRLAVEALPDAHNVTLLGHRNDVADLMAAADVVAICSRAEGLPGTLLEALALEARVIATSIPPVLEIVGPEGGPAQLVPVGDVAALGKAIVRALLDPSPPHHAAAGRELIERSFSVEASAKAMVAFYERSLGRSGGSVA